MKEKIIKKILWCLPKKISHTLLYLKTHKTMINWKNPKTYDEKLRWLLVNEYGENEAIYADKYKVRKYVEECGLKKILIPILGVWNNSAEIELNKLPNKFILKANHGSGDEFYSIIFDKSDEIRMKQELKKLDNSLKINFAKESCEYHYKTIKPKIVAEQFLEDENKRLTDYKILCFKGNPKYILVCSERNKGRDYFDLNWNYVPFAKEEYRSKKEIKKPKNLEKMIEYASVLAKPFSFARIDFYNLNGEVYFGEITLTPAACFHYNITDEAQLTLGKLIELPIEGEKNAKK